MKLQVTEIDKDDDGKDDEMSLSLFITNTTKNLITALHLFLVFDYKIYVSFGIPWNAF